MYTMKKCKMRGMNMSHGLFKNSMASNFLKSIMVLKINLMEILWLMDMMIRVYKELNLPGFTINKMINLLVVYIREIEIH